ncbi:hypothetical protein VTK26DRAFT_8428 [Humicola hyalothermophila]
MFCCHCQEGVHTRDDVPGMTVFYNPWNQERECRNLSRVGGLGRPNLGGKSPPKTKPAISTTSHLYDTDMPTTAVEARCSLPRFPD